jgi:hypothetical protein
MTFRALNIFRKPCMRSIHMIVYKHGLNIFSETLYEDCSYNCVQTWYCTVNFVCTGIYLLQELDFK